MGSYIELKDNISEECIRKAIINRIHYTYKDVYYRSYNLNDESIKE